MAGADVLLAFVLSAAVFAFVPGPAMLYAAARTLAGGRRAGLWAAAGIACGGLVHAAAAAAGLSAVFHAVPALYAAVKLFGAAYLVWLGVGMLRSGLASASGTAAAALGPGPGEAFRQSVLVELLNPKTALFFVAFLPQFVDPSGSLAVSVQLGLLGLVVVAMFGLGDLVAIFAAAAVTGSVRRRPRLMAALGRAGGVVLVGLGLRLAAERA
jgi:threonine/homoserine/homoserine lactone efflux protein